MRGVDPGVVVPHLVAVDHRAVRRAEDAAGVEAAAFATRNDRRPVGEPVPVQSVPAVRQLRLDGTVPGALFGTELRRSGALDGGVQYHVEDRQEPQKLAAVAESGHPVELAALVPVQGPAVVLLIGLQDRPGRRPAPEVLTGRNGDEPALERVCSPAAMEREVGAILRPPGQGDGFQYLVYLVAAGEHGVARVLLPIDAVGGMSDPIAALRAAPIPGHHPVAFIGVGSRRIDDQAGTVLVEGDDVVGPGAVERKPAQVGLLPMQAVRRGGVEDQVALPLPHLR